MNKQIELLNKIAKEDLYYYCICDQCNQVKRYEDMYSHNNLSDDLFGLCKKCKNKNDEIKKEENRQIRIKEGIERYNKMKNFLESK